MINFLKVKINFFFTAPANEDSTQPMTPQELRNEISKIRKRKAKPEKRKNNSNSPLTPEEYSKLFKEKNKKSHQTRIAKVGFVEVPAAAEALKNISNHLYLEGFTSLPREKILQTPGIKISSSLKRNNVNRNFKREFNNKKEPKVISKLNTIKEEGAREIGSSVQKLSSPGSNRQKFPNINQFTFATPKNTSSKKNDKLPSIGSINQFTFNNINTSGNTKSNNKVLVDNYTNPISNFTIQKKEEIQSPLNKKPNVKFNYISPNNPRVLNPNNIGKHKIKVNFDYSNPDNISSNQYCNIKPNGIQVLSKDIERK